VKTAITRLRRFRARRCARIHTMAGKVCDPASACGASTLRKAASFAEARIASTRRPVSCTPVSLDQYGRTVATCSVGDIDLGEWLVRNGLAIDWPQYSKGKFDTIQRDAEHAGQLRRAMAISGLRPGRRKPEQLLRRCGRTPLAPDDCALCHS
jgi:hypothetical protein